jgi:hypothetical protein
VAEQPKGAFVRRRDRGMDFETLSSDLDSKGRWFRSGVVHRSFHESPVVAGLRPTARLAVRRTLSPEPNTRSKMRRPRTILIMAATAAMALSSLATPATAAVSDPFVAFVHGMPGIGRIDICIDGVEVRSRMKYGKVFKVMPTLGLHKFVLKKAAPGRCKGATLAKNKEILPSHSSTTVVLSKVQGRPGVHAFNNFGFHGSASPAALSAPILVQNAAKASALAIYLASFNVTDIRGPNAVLARGEQWISVEPVGYYSVWASKVDSLKPLIGPSLRLVKLNHLRHYVLVGQKPKNFKVVSFLSPYPEA